MPTLQYRITFGEAVNLVSNYVQHLPETAKQGALGGTLKKESLFGHVRQSTVIQKMMLINEAAVLYNGNMAWFCWDSNLTVPLFLAFEENDSYEATIPVRFPGMPNLMKPGHTFLYQDENIENLLQTHRFDPSQYSDRIVTRDAAMALIENFRNFGPRDGSVRYNNFPYGFFENTEKDDMRQFLNQTGLTHVRYYFGYDPDIRYQNSNRIRVILVGVDANGANIVPSGTRTEEEVIIIQKSWPPPPTS